MRFRIAFLVDSVPFGPGEIAGDKSLGGSESACLGTARALQARGHHVHVFASKLHPECRGLDTWGVSWHHAADFREVSRIFEWDVVCGLRMPQAFTQPINARLRVLWNQDLMNVDTYKNAIMAIAWALDAVGFVSDFHRQQWKDWVPELDPIAFVTKNGFDPALLPESSTKDPRRIIHISRPERGLKPLLQMWPQLRERKPHATLQICRYSSMYDTGAGSWSEVCADFDRQVAALNDTVGGIEYLGELGKRELYQAISDAAVMWYPGVPTFAETSCLAAVEAQACGTPFVGSYKGALPETIPSGVLVPGDAFTQDYQQHSIDAVLQLLDGCATNSVAYRRLQNQGRAHAAAYRFDVIAAEWERWIEAQFRDRYAREKLGVLRQLLHYDDHVAARVVANDIIANDPSYPPNGGDGTGDVLAEARKAEDFCDRVIAGLDQTSEQYAQHALEPIFELRHPANNRLRIVQQTFAEATRVVDVACGNGAMAIALAEANPNVRITAIDYAENNIAAGQHAAQELGVADRIEFICAPVWDFDTRTLSAWWTDWSASVEKFDGLFCGEFVEHVSDCTALVDGLESVCLPDAQVLITVPNGPMSEYRTRQTTQHKGHVHHFANDDLLAVWGEKKAISCDLLTWPNQTPNGHTCGNWIIKYRVSGVPTGHRDLAHRIVTTRPRRRLSVGILTLNAEHDLLRCLDSIWPIADEILLGDTGSGDTTKAIAATVRNVRVLDLAPIVDQPDGFAGARNEVLRACTGDWFLWIDTDEVLAGAHLIDKYLESTVYLGFAIFQTHLQLDAPVHADSPVRLFRRLPDIQFYGCVHEQPQRGDCNGDITPALQLHELAIAHTGYMVEGVRKKKMLERNFPLLVRDKQRFPERTLGKVLILRDLVNLADAAAEEAGYKYPPQSVDFFKRAIGLFEAELADPAHRYHSIGRPWYERALQALHIGIEVEASLGCQPGGMNGDRPKARRFWIREPNDLKRLLDWQVSELVKKLEPPQLRVEPLAAPDPEAVPV